MTQIKWLERGIECAKPLKSENQLSVPKKIFLVGDEFKADDFYRQASEGAGFLWQGDFQNAKQLLQAVQRRIDKKATSTKSNSEHQTGAQAFHRYRQKQAHRAQLLSRLYIYIDKDLKIPLRRAPDVKLAIIEAFDTSDGDFVISLKDLLGIIGAHEWRKKGVLVPAISERIHAHYGLFSPVRNEYLDLVMKAPLASHIQRALDLGAGTGVIAIGLAKRGIQKIIACDIDERAIACASENIKRLKLSDRIVVIKADMYPAGQDLFDLIVCNPPWLPARPTSSIERAVYDENNQMLEGFLKGAAQHLQKNGEAWLIISDLAERLGLRDAGLIESLALKSNLKIADKLSIEPRHTKAFDSNDPLFHARSKEIVYLYRLRAS